MPTPVVLDLRPQRSARRADEHRQRAIGVALALSVCMAAAALASRIMVTPAPTAASIPIDLEVKPQAPSPALKPATDVMPDQAPAPDTPPEPATPAPVLPPQTLLPQTLLPPTQAPPSPAPHPLASRAPPPRKIATTPPPLASVPSHPAPPDTSAAPTGPTPPSPGEIATFQAGMRRAVREALIYPPAARMAGQKGDVRVAFDYLDGAATNVALAGSSGLPLLDRAALATVQSARYGQPPATLSHRTIHLSILVQFDPDSP